jgi:LPS sulfotransferase NodH
VRLQEPGDWDVDTWIIRRYQTVFDAFFEEREFIPPGRLVELRYEDLARDPLAQLQRIYEQLDLPDFAVVRPAVQRYLARQREYRTNTYAELPSELRSTLAREWRRNFEVWGYADE